MLTMLAVLLAAPLTVCPPQTLVEPTRIHAGETMEFRLDVLGADVGTFDVRIEPPPATERPRATLMLRSRQRPAPSSTPTSAVTRPLPPRSWAAGSPRSTTGRISTK